MQQRLEFRFPRPARLQITAFHIGLTDLNGDRKAPVSFMTHSTGLVHSKLTASLGHFKSVSLQSRQRRLW